MTKIIKHIILLILITWSTNLLATDDLAIVPRVTVLRSTVPVAGIFGAGENLDFISNFSENVSVNTSIGSPKLSFTLTSGGTIGENRPTSKYLTMSSKSQWVNYTYGNGRTAASPTTSISAVSSATPFVTTWQTSGATNLVTIPLAGAGYDFTIDWGDGTPTEIKTGTLVNISHTYSTAGIKTVSITPNILTGFPRIYVNNFALKSNLLTVESWGSGQWGADLSNAFFGANNLEVNATDVPNFSATTSFSRMFEGCTSLTGANGFSNWTLNTNSTANVVFFSMFKSAVNFNGDISNWDVSYVTNMSRMFEGASVFNAPLNWGSKTGNVTNMSRMFSQAPQFNQDINGWDVSKVTTTSTMFYFATSFNQPLNSWNVGNVTVMNYMFGYASAFNQDISTWNVINVTNMSSMFERASVFNAPLNWGSKTGNVTNMSKMFDRASQFNQDIKGWNVGNVTDMNYMFGNAGAFNQDISTWNVINVTNMSSMFEGASVFNAPLNWGLKTGNVTDMSRMFIGAPQFNQDINGWDVSKVTTTSLMFYNTTSFNQPLNSWNVSNVTNMGSMFGIARAFNQDISTWNVMNVTNMSSMFNGAPQFNQNLSAWNVANVTNMSSMFQSATNFNSPLNWGVKTANVTNMSSMFESARAFNQDLSDWDVSKVTTMFKMFISASAFNSPLDWNTKTANVTNMEGMFKAAILFNQDISNWDVGKVTTLNYMFRETKAFNQDLSAWNVANVTTMSEMFYQASAFNSPLNWGVKTGKVTNMSVMFYLAGAFNQDIGNWNISNVTSMTNFLFGARLSRANYDKLLVGWSTLDAGETKIPINLNVHFGSSKYSNSTARDTELRGSKNWTITDGGLDSDFVLPIISSNMLASDNKSISITFSEGVYKTSLGSGTLEISDFLFSLSGGAATLNTTTPSSISTSNNFTFILGIDINGTPNGDELLTVTPMLDAIFDLSGNAAATSQDNNTVLLNDLSPPNISMPSGDAVSITENSTAVFTFTASKSVTWSLGTADDAALLNIDSSGNLAFNTAPDFENPISTLSSNTYLVDVIATDAVSNTATKTLTITVLDIPSTTFGTFAAINKQYFSGPHTIVPPTTTNSNPIFYTSDNTAVATISGLVITFTGIGTATITATQATDINYEGGTVSTLLTVLGKDLVSRYGGVSSTDVNYVNANGKVGGGFGVDKYGAVQYVDENIITSGLIMHLDAGNPASYSGTGTTWIDISGNGNHGTLVNGVGYTSVNSGALVFDGVNDYFVTNNNFNLSSTDKLTVQIILKTASTRSEMIMEHSVNWNNNNSYGVIINNLNDKVQFVDKNQGYNARNSAATIIDNNWRLFSATTDRSLNATNQTLIYIDGDAPSSVIEPTLANDNSGNFASHKLYIASRAGSSIYFKGNIAQVFIYNRALTALEIQQNYNAVKLKYGL